MTPSSTDLQMNQLIFQHMLRIQRIIALGFTECLNVGNGGVDQYELCITMLLVQTHVLERCNSRFPEDFSNRP
jgi:hypothetical protein